jgi:hypothetical protein
MAILDEEALAERARNLDANGLNGLRLALVALHPAAAPTEARLEVHFHNDHELAAILAEAAGGTAPRDLFPIRGGHRLRGGAAAGQVQVTDIQPGPDVRSLSLTVRPIGDYSTYRLAVQHANMDPVFDEIAFKFRPGCFSTDCAPERPTSGPRPPAPVIDYLARDYDSFRHALIVAMRRRVPGWEPTSEADFSMLLLSLLSVAGDELCDYQDRVMNEAYLTSARNRVSLARHARLMDYHIHQGNQASTWLALRVAGGLAPVLSEGFEAWTGQEDRDGQAIIFRSRQAQPMHHLLNDARLYTWSGSRPGLAAGATEADLQMPSQAEAEAVRDLIRAGGCRRLLLQEHRNPGTGGEAGHDPAKRQLLELAVSDEAPEVGQDPLTGDWFLHVAWRVEDRLTRDYCFTRGGQRDDIALFHGNLVRVFQGRLVQVTFRPSGPIGPGERLYSRTPDEEQRPGSWKPDRSASVVLPLPAGEPLLYQSTPVEPRGEIPTASTLELDVDGATWTEVISLVHSQDSDPHYALETDELGRSVVRFGNGVNGRELPSGAVVRCTYQAGSGPEGNVGADRVRHLDFAAHPEIVACWNPFDVIDGRAPEPRDEIVRGVPEAFRARQLRAVTLADYVRRAEELPGVARASARYAWTGSWRAVTIPLDPSGGETLTEVARQQTARHLDAVRLIGDDLEIRPPRFVPLTLVLRFCVHPDFWVDDVRFDLEAAFSDEYTASGEPGFFHPDRWTFGQALHASQVIGRALLVPGVERILRLTMRRWDSPTSGAAEPDVINVRPNEIIQVRNDPDHMELGTITFEPEGGRQ